MQVRNVCRSKMAGNICIYATTLTTMITITVKYKAKWRLKNNQKYVWTECGRLFNLNSSREIKKTVKGLTPGYWIGRSFMPLESLRNNIEKIPVVEVLPF